MTNIANAHSERVRRAPATAVAAALLVLGLAAGVGADHYPDDLRGRVRRKDRDLLAAMRRLSYTYSDAVPVTAGTCDCLELACAPGAFLLSCGGEIDPHGAGALTAVRRTDYETCLVCGCGWVEAAVRATPVCAGF